MHSGFVYIRGHYRCLGRWKEGCICEIVARSGENSSDVNSGCAAEDAYSEASKASVSGASIGETVRRHPIVNNIGEMLMAADAAVNFSAEPKYEEAAIEPPYTPYPTPQQMEGPWIPHSAEVKRAVEAGVAEQKKFGISKHYPLVAHLELAQL